MSTNIVKRNETEQSLITKKVLKGQYKDTPYLGFQDATAENRPQLDKFLGDEVVNKMYNTWLNQLCINAMYNNAEYGPKDNDGFAPIVSVNWQKVIESIEELSLAGETLGEMKDRKISLLDEMKNLFTDLFGSDQQKAVAAKLRCQQIKEEVQVLDTSIAAREEEFAKRQEKKKLTEAAKDVEVAAK